MVIELAGREPQAPEFCLDSTLITKAGGIFAVCGLEGDIDGDATAEHGLYFHDTRFLSGSVLRVAGQSPEVVRSTAASGDASISDLSSPALVLPSGLGLPAGALAIRRRRYLQGEMVERIEIQSFDGRRLRIPVEVGMSADFQTIFAVRGVTRGRRGTLRRPRWLRGHLHFMYRGGDGRRRTSTVTFDPPPAERLGAGARWLMELGPGEKAEIVIRVRLRDEGPGRLESVPAVRSPFTHRSARVATSNPMFDAVLQRSLDDLGMLATQQEDLEFFAAGAPWFVALFGRDSLITAYQVLAYNPAIAAATLRLLARLQGQSRNAWRDEEPGKILHELRMAEDANLGDTPHTPYYGSVDSTPLFLILLVEYVRWTGDVELWRQLRGNAERALQWIDGADRDGDGFLEYSRVSEHGLDNQGWKDCGHSIVREDGSLAVSPIALVEVQGYVYRAKLGLAWLHRLEGDEVTAGRLEEEARELRHRFNRSFWMPRQGFLALALEAGGGQVGSISSNPGQALWSGIVDPDAARAVADRLVGGSMYSGWGIRTLARGEKAYDPDDYQVGAIWPHDNSLILAGLKRGGFDQEAVVVFTGIFQAACGFPDHRLPEVFSGHTRGEGEQPRPYAVACNPQAWSAATLPFMLTSVLGLEPDAPAQRLRLRHPGLPPWLKEVTLTGLRVGDATLDLRFRRRPDGFAEHIILAQHGEVRIEVI